MKSFLSIQMYRDPKEGRGFVVFNDIDRKGHNFVDLFPHVEIDGEVYTTRKVTSSQIHIVKKRTRIIIYVHELI